MARFAVCRWISAENDNDLDSFISNHRGDIARDLDGDPVFMASDAFSLNYEAERAPAIRMIDIKEYQTQ